MTDTAVDNALSTKEVSTTIERGPQPMSGDKPLTNQQKELVEKTWGLVEPDLQGAGVLLFKKYAVLINIIYAYAYNYCFCACAGYLKLHQRRFKCSPTFATFHWNNWRRTKAFERTPCK